MAKIFPNTVACTAVPGGELFKVADDGTQALSIAPRQRLT
jgi:hypothetical protein